MARRGRFGRRPRAGGNMTALIAQLYREQRSAEDRVMFDAYQNGGLVDGKPVTDGRIRDYISSRRDGFSKDDPMYDEWNNRLIQVDFKIGEEKITLAFQQGKVGAGAVASFYRGELGKIAKDSAFYREVAGRAAQWAKSAAGAARGAAGRRLTSALSAKQDGVARTWGNFSALEAIITEAAKRAGLIAGNQDLTDADASRLQDLFAAGIIGPKGTAITFDDWRNASVAAYKAFDTQIAINKQLNRGTKELTTGKEKFLDQNLVRINVIDDRAKYEAARDVWTAAIDSAQGDPRAILEASAKYAATLSAIKANAEKDGGLAKNDPEFIGGLVNEINAVTTGKFSGPTVFDLQSTSTEAVTNGDGQGTADSITKVIADAKALDTGAAFYGQSEFGGPLGVVYYAPGSALDPFGRNGLGPDTQDALLTVNGKPTPVKLKGQPVKSSGLTAPDGSPVENVPDGNGGFVPVQNLSAGQIQFLLQNGYAMSDATETVGYVFSQNGKTTYGVYAPDGSIKFTDQNPWTGAFGPSEGGFTIVTSSTFDGAGKVVSNTPPISLDLSTAAGLLVDPSVLPSDLRNAAKNAPDEESARKLLDLADQRQAKTAADHNISQPELDVQNRGNRRTEVSPLSGFVTGVNDFVRQAIGVLGEAAAPPKLGGMGGPRLEPNQPPPLTAPAPAAGPPPPAAAAPPALPPAGAPGAYRPPPPPPPVNPGGAPGAYRPPPPPPKPKPGNVAS